LELNRTVENQRRWLEITELMKIGELGYEAEVDVVELKNMDKELERVRVEN
jgi:hypothetical protein